MSSRTGNKGTHDLRSYLAFAEISMIEWVKQSGNDLRSTRKLIFAS
jgi:hypothetical protein